MIKNVIIIGGHIQALGLARQIFTLGIKVILFIEDKWSVARFSNTIHKTILFSSEMDFLEKIEDYADSGTMLFPTADNYVEILSKNFNKLKEHFFVAIPPTSCVETFCDKRKTYQFAAKNNIPHPQSWYPNNIKDVYNISDKIEYPVVVKPAVMYSFHKIFGKKAFRCDSKDSLIKKCEEISTKIPLSSILIQEFLSGGTKALYSYGVLAINGTPKAWIIANRIRQNPMDFGNSTTFAITCYISEIEQSAKKILNVMNYTGLAEVEFMYDEESGNYKFLEINTRAWKWHSISMGLGFGFLSEWICYLNNENGSFKETNKPMAWVERLTDYTIILKESLKGRMNIFDALKSYHREKVSAVWSWKDPLPAFIYVLISPILYLKRY